MKNGFTLVEILVTLSLIALIASIAFPLIQIDSQRNKEKELKENLREIRQALDAYKVATEEGRILRLADQSGYPENLQVLVDGVPDLKDPKGRKVFFLRSIPTDPFAPDGDKASSQAKTWQLRSYASPANAPTAGDDVYDIHSKSRKKALDGTYYAKW
jgi:general secretion pathway protein G